LCWTFDVVRGPESASGLRLSWLAASDNAVLSPLSLWLGPPVRLGLIVGSFDVVANFDVRTVTSPFRSG
jgi:hypothetical protein